MAHGRRRHDPVPAEPLGGVQEIVGSAYESVQILTWLPLRHARRDRDVPHAGTQELGHRRANALAEHVRSFEARRKNGYELLPAPARDDVRLPHLSGENAGDPAKDLVTDQVTVHVVHPFEMI